MHHLVSIIYAIAKVILLIKSRVEELSKMGKYRLNTTLIPPSSRVNLAFHQSKVIKISLKITWNQFDQPYNTSIKFCTALFNRNLNYNN